MEVVTSFVLIDIYIYIYIGHYGGGNKLHVNGYI